MRLVRELKREHDNQSTVLCNNGPGIMIIKVLKLYELTREHDAQRSIVAQGLQKFQ